MVQILPRTKLTFGEQVASGLTKGFDTGTEFAKMFSKQKMEQRQKQDEDAKKLAASSEKEEQNYQQIKNAFGEQFADVWKASPVGARTALENAALQQGLRKLPIGGLFGEEETADRGKTSGKSSVVKTPSGGEFNLPEIPQPEGQTPAENVKYRRELRNDNKPILKENIDKSRALKDTASHLDILESLNDKIPEGVSRLLIDKEGNIRPTALRFKAVPKEVERFAKTVNDFLTSAKDMFGARVTNYDIAQFKSRLPGLLNSREGRKEITEQMKIFNKMERNYRNALKTIYQHYGLEGIPQEEAERLAEEMVHEEEESLRSQLLEIGNPTSNGQNEPQERASLEEIFG